LDLLRFGICGLAFDSEKQWSGPPSAGDEAGDFGETLVAGALVLVPFDFDIHQMNPIAPLTNQSCSGADAGSASDCVITSFFECQTELMKSFPSAGSLALLSEGRFIPDSPIRTYEITGTAY